MIDPHADDDVCLNCARWDIANSRYDYKTEGKLIAEFYDTHSGTGAFPDLRPPHANQAWAQCFSACEGWTDEFDPEKHRMAVWDGSQYMAKLLTHAFHGCKQFQRRTP